MAARTGVSPSVARVGAGVASRGGGGDRGAPVTCVARRSSSAVRVSWVSTQQRRTLTAVGASSSASSASSSQLALAFGAGGGGGSCFSRGARRSSRRGFAAPPRAAADDDDEDDDDDEGPEEDWEKLFANMQPLVPELPRYKVAILEKALSRGRRQVPVRDLARDLDLTREDILAWLKANADRQAELAKQFPPEPERVAVVKLAWDDDGFREDGPRDGDGRVREEYDAQTAYLRNAPNAREGPHVPKGAPEYKGFVKKRLGASNVATLEKVFEQNRYPDDDMVDSVYRATKLPRSKIVAWFKTKREEEKSAKRRAVRGRFDDRFDDRLDGGGGGRDEDGFYDGGGAERRGSRGRGRGGRGGGGGGRERRDGPGGGWRGNNDADMPRGGKDSYGAADQERGRRDSTTGWSSSRD